MNPEEFRPLTPEDEALAEAVEALMQGKSLRSQVKSPELEMAARMKAMGEAPKLRPSFDAQMEDLLLQKFAKPQEESSWMKAWMPRFAGGLAFAALALVVIFNPFAAGPSLTIAEVQGFESLSEAEEVLGALPENAVTEDGILVADLRASIHQINLIESSTNIELDPNAEIYEHVELRNAALEIIETEFALQQELNTREIAIADTGLSNFTVKVSGWPTYNEGVDYETHERAVNGFINHNANFDAAMLELAEEIVDELIWD